jgi:HAD superfamily hydrolase (TIGR01509 family)
MIRWVFLDVGNILLDEDPLTFHVFCRHVEAIRQVQPEKSFDALLAELDVRTETGSAWPLHGVAAAYLGERRCAEVWEEVDREVRARFAELSPLIPGAQTLVEELAARYRLGLIANQGPECREWLKELGLWDRFEVTALSELEGVFKPDLALFRRALERAAARPEESLMVGDRIDNDLAPAAALGMATAWVSWPRRSEKGWSPEDPQASAYLISLERMAARKAAHWTGTKLQLQVKTLRELRSAMHDCCVFQDS